MLSLVWFKRDLRVHDHPALVQAAGAGAVLPVWIAEPEQWAQPDASARHWAFLDESLRSLRADLAALGQPLILRTGEAVEVLARLQAKHGFTRIVTHPETGSAWARARQDRVADWARGRGLDWQVVAEEGEGPVLAPPALAPVAEATGALPGLRALGLAEDRCPYRQPGGRDAALSGLESYLAVRGQGHAGRATALGAERAGSRLSPYLAYGVLSAREVRAAMAEARARWRGQPDWAAALRALGGQLRAREAARGAPLVALGGAGEAGAWGRGETGLPYVDAAMRALMATGWLDARSRALLAAVGLHHLRLDPAVVAQHLARLSTDHDPAIQHQALRQVALGRIPDPVAMGRALDPQGAFLRRWLPELARVPEAHLQAPWLWPGARRALAGRYPEPVLDPATAARAARALRLPVAARATAPVRRRAPGPQMALDL